MTLVPSSFYDDSCAREYLAQVVDISADTQVCTEFLSQFDAYFIYAGPEEPALLRVLRKLMSIPEYNKLLCDWDGKTLSLAIAQGRSLMLSNTYKAEDFVTVMYFVLMAMKSLQLNPELSTLCFLGSLSNENQIALYHYFKAVRLKVEQERTNH